MMTIFDDPIQVVLGILLILSSLGIILTKKPVHAGLSFLLTLLLLSVTYLHLSAEFIAVMQVIVYAGAILVIFMFVIVLFQDAHEQIDKYKPKCSKLLIYTAASTFLITVGWYVTHIYGVRTTKDILTDGFGSVETIGRALYLDFFFPFEAVILLFLVALVGALYIGRKEV